MSPSFVSFKQLVETKNTTFLFRPYNHAVDYGQLKTICKNVYSGADFVPCTARALSNEVRCAPHVFCDESGVACFVNLRLRETLEHEQRSFLFCEALRIREDIKSKGLGAVFLAAAMLAVYKFYQPVEKRNVSLLAVTTQHNTVMRNLFRKFRWSSHQVMCVWLTPAVVLDAKLRNIPMLESLQLSPSISSEASALSKLWTQILSAVDILDVMKTLRKRGASYRRPLYFDIESAERASEFLTRNVGPSGD